ncbi:DUF1918 domain-containing protein [Streptomyces brasiliensis]|uniref:DUF1918 domain-containing protein n=1 Tax=Streptomyces brasiliensis TaxID=1954 RepID=A0A917NFZ5_9ACTN|nr:DUF1918 domain-containing protein [Streptomyces brasiliensis]GGI94538.1 hypothetical protein GCM10010121_001140 [Streptomyces brasiliensis]
MASSAPARKSDRTAGRPRVEATGTGTRARVGGEIVVHATTSGAVTRDGEVVEVHHRNGSPPYDVRRADDERVTLCFPGPDADVRCSTHTPNPGTAPS